MRVFEFIGWHPFELAQRGGCLVIAHPLASQEDATLQKNAQFSSTIGITDSLYSSPVGI